MPWVFLGIAGLLEVFWATFLKLSHGFTKLSSPSRSARYSGCALKLLSSVRSSRTRSMLHEYVWNSHLCASQLSESARSMPLNMSR